MKSQWQCIQENIGTWHGSFTQFDADGQQLKDTPSVLTLAETEPNKTIQLTLERTPANGSPDIICRSFSAPGLAPYVYFLRRVHLLKDLLSGQLLASLGRKCR
ncbi:MAG: DUF3598 family protein [Phormidesmis sp. RL_2_1]|nr:DUF3598 family protein [Phormidesmis sp. RL_2_1]